VTGGARRRRQLALAFGHDRNTDQQRGGRRRGHRNRTVGRAHAARADDGRQRPDRRRLEVRDRGRDTDDVGDRIVGAHLVKRDPIHLRAVQLRLHLGDSLEDVRRQIPCLRLQLRLLQQPLHLRIIAMIMLVHVHVLVLVIVIVIVVVVAVLVLVVRMLMRVRVPPWPIDLEAFPDERAAAPA